MVWNLTSMAISNIEQYIESVDIVHRNKFINKRTGFETTKHAVHAVSGTDVLVDIAITYVADLPREVAQQLIRLANGTVGGGMALEFVEDFVTGGLYTGRWVNAGAYRDESAVRTGCEMVLACYAWSEY
jgi:hypothetical protein